MTKKSLYQLSAFLGYDVFENKKKVLKVVDFVHVNYSGVYGGPNLAVKNLSIDKYLFYFSKERRELDLLSRELEDKGFIKFGEIYSVFD